MLSVVAVCPLCFARLAGYGAESTGSVGSVSALRVSGRLSPALRPFGGAWGSKHSRGKIVSSDCGCSSSAVQDAGYDRHSLVSGSGQLGLAFTKAASLNMIAMSYGMSNASIRGGGRVRMKNL